MEASARRCRGPSRCPTYERCDEPGPGRDLEPVFTSIHDRFHRPSAAARRVLAGASRVGVSCPSRNALARAAASVRCLVSGCR